jgi:hypothetical protein
MHQQTYHALAMDPVIIPPWRMMNLNVGNPRWLWNPYSS